MKRVTKGAEPASLIAHRLAFPNSTWEQMRNNAPQAYRDCRSTAICDQKGLCAYCEIDIGDNNPLKCRVEHFHPKSDSGPRYNWGLDLGNMLGVCNGGSNESVQAPGFHLAPLERNLSCDAHKDRKIQKKELPEKCEGFVLDPLQIAAFPSLFRLEKSSGAIRPDSDACTAVVIADNRHLSTEKLVAHTIEMLNLNCDRLTRERLRVIYDIERRSSLHARTAQIS